MIIYAHAGAAYAGVCREVLEAGSPVAPVASPTSPSRGAETVEVVAHAFAVADPRARFAESATRPLNVAFPLGAFLNVLAGRDDVASTAWYNPVASRFSDDGASLRGAYGPRVAEGLRAVVDLLRRDPSTRRAVVTIFDHRVDYVESVDVPCPLSVQFLARGGRLHAVATFRSQDAATVFPYDLALFTLLHEYVAAQAGLALGTYHQRTGSMHVYGAGAAVDERPLARAVAEGPSAAWPMPPMEAIDREALADVLAVEAALRSGWSGAPPDASGLPPFWRGVVRFLHVFALARRDGRAWLRDPDALRLAFGESVRAPSEVVP